MHTYIKYIITEIDLVEQSKIIKETLSLKD